MYLIIWTFFAYAFLGWCMEVCYAALTTGKFVNRGFLNGPVCPIYGCGAVIVLWLLDPLRENTLLLFLGSVVLSSALELLTGFVLEKLFRQRWWDYSNEPFNLGGYICLRFSIAWGLACLFVTDLLQPSILWVIQLVPLKAGWVLLAVFAAAGVVDCAATVQTISRMNLQLRQIDEVAERMKDFSNTLGENLADQVLDAAERSGELREDLQEKLDESRELLSRRKAALQDSLENLKDTLEDAKESRDESRQARQLEQLHWVEARQRDLEELAAKLGEAKGRYIFGQKRLLYAFPRMRSITHRQALERVRRWLEKKI